MKNCYRVLKTQGILKKIIYHYLKRIILQEAWWLTVLNTTKFN